MTEVWKPVVGFEGLYEVSNTGHIRRNGKILKAAIIGRRAGYYMCALSNKGRYIKYNHRAVAEAFIPNPEGKRTVNHKDGNNHNNHVDNLEWMTDTENQWHAITKLGTGQLKLTLDKASEIRERYKNGEKVKDLATAYGVTTATIYNIKNNKAWKGL